MGEAAAPEAPPDFTPGGYYATIDVGPHALVFYRNGEVRFRHTCDRADRGVIVCAPLLGEGHMVTGAGADCAVNPSILCSDCGTHGFVIASEWRSA